MRTRSIALLVVVLVLLIAPSAEAGKPRAPLYRPGHNACTAGTWDVTGWKAYGSVRFSRTGDDLTVTVQLRNALPDANYEIYPRGSAGSACDSPGNGLNVDYLHTDSRGAGSLTFTTPVATGNVYFDVSMCSPDAYCTDDFMISWPEVYAP